MRSRNYFSTTHLRSAWRFAELADAFEIRLVDSDVYDPNQDLSEHRSLVVASLFATVAFFESAVNELFQDAFEDHLSHLTGLDPAIRESMGEFWRLIAEHSLNTRSRFGTIEKYEMALSLAHVEPIDHEEELYADVRRVIRIQNALVHYKPSRLMRIDESGFEEDLQGRFALNRLTVKTELPHFPDKVLGSGCARWAIDCTRRFSDLVFDRIGVVPEYARAVKLK